MSANEELWTVREEAERIEAMRHARRLEERIGPPRAPRDSWPFVNHRSMAEVHTDEIRRRRESGTPSSRPCRARLLGVSSLTYAGAGHSCAGIFSDPVR